MRRAARLLCSKIDLDGRPSAYYPRFRPRRLVMPVDPDKVHSSARARNPMLARYQKQERLKRMAQRRGSIRLADVPAERTVGDAFRYMLEVCERGRLFEPAACFSAPPFKELEMLVEKMRSIQASEAAAGRAAQAETGAKEADACTTSLPASSGAGGGTAVRVRAVDEMWSLLDRTLLNAPVHGALAMRGKALVECTIATAAQEAFPRLRSKHLQQLLHETCGLLPASRVCVRLGLAQHAGVEGEIGMWRELNVLTQRMRHARDAAAAHRERVEKGVAQQRRWYWRGVLRSALGRLKMFPVHEEDLLPRLEWVRSTMFAFVGFLDLAQRSGEPGVDVRTLVLKMYGAQLGRFVYRRGLLSEAEGLVAQLGHPPPDAGVAQGGVRDTHCDCGGPVAEHRRRVVEDAVAQLQMLRTRTPDELDVLEGTTHPLNDRDNLRREQLESSGGVHAVQSLKDDIFDDYRAVRHADAAPALVVHALETQNALKEAQLILRHAPDVAAALRNAPIDVDQVVRRTVEVHETNSYATLRYDQQYRQVEYTVCRLFCGPHCVGEGKGDSLMAAIQQAALHMTTNYYLKRPKGGEEDGVRGAPADEPSGEAGKVRMREARVEQDIAL